MNHAKWDPTVPQLGGSNVILATSITITTIIIIITNFTCRKNQKCLKSISKHRVSRRLSASEGVGAEYEVEKYTQ